MIIRKTWRSEWFLTTFFLVSLVACVKLSHLLPVSVIRGDIWREPDLIIWLRLPLFWLIPAFVLGLLLIRLYDVRYRFSNSGIEATYGIVSLRQKVVRIRFEDVRAVEAVQSLFERFLRIGIVEISTSATGGIEVIMEGIAYPRLVQEIILAERDRISEGVSR